VRSAAPLHFLILLASSWLGRHQTEAIEHLRAENRVLRAHRGPKRLRFTEAERRVLAWSLNTISDSRGVSIIEVEESAKPFAATDGTRLVGSTGRWKGNDIAEPLVIPSE
jgi:hypothetical protein